MDAHHFDGNDFVVDQQSERDNQRAERYFLQVDPQNVHRAKGSGEYERDAKRDDEPRAPTEADEIDCHDDSDRFDERLDEFSDRFFDHLRLVGDLMNFHAERQFRLRLIDQSLLLTSELEDISAGRHRHGDPDCGLTVIKKLRLRRLRVAPLDRRDVGETENFSARIDRHAFDRVNVVEHAAHSNINVVGRSLEHARRRHCV